MNYEDLYLAEIAAYPLLDAEQEKSLGNLIQAGKSEKAELERLFRSGDLDREAFAQRLAVCERELQEAKDRFTSSNLRLVVHIAGEFENRGLPLGDLISEGNIGLMKAVDRFDPSRGVRFSTYAAWWIKQSIRKALADKARVVRLPVYLQKRIRRHLEEEADLRQSLGREPTNAEVAARTGRSARELMQFAAGAESVRSIEEPMGGSKDECLLDLIPDPARADLLDGIFIEDCRKVLKEGLACLSERELLVLRMRFAVPPGRAPTLAEIGRRLGLSSERVRQIQKGAFRKLEKMRSVQQLFESIDLN